MLTERLQMKDLGKLKHFLGIDFDQTEGKVKMSQKRYVNRILERFEMQGVDPEELHVRPNWNTKKMQKK